MPSAEMNNDQHNALHNNQVADIHPPQYSLFNSLIATISSVKESITKLGEASLQFLKGGYGAPDQTHDKVLKLKQMASEKRCGIHFPQFPLLPLELRREIWTIAFTENEQIITIFHGGRMSLSQINIIASACKEAYQTLLKLNLDFLTAYPETEEYANHPHVLNPHRCLPNYFNPAIDTIHCVFRVEFLLGVCSENVFWGCGKCYKERKKEVGVEEKLVLCCSSPEVPSCCAHKTGLHKLAIHWEDVMGAIFNYPESCDDDRYNFKSVEYRNPDSWMPTITAFSIKNLALLVDDDEMKRRDIPLSWERPLHLVPPPSF